MLKKSILNKTLYENPFLWREFKYKYKFLKPRPAPTLEAGFAAFVITILLVVCFI